MPCQTLKFIGEFRDLIPMGFKFHKLYASNYRCYSKDMIPYRSTIWIWQKGRSVEYQDYYAMTGDIFRALLDDTKFPWLHHCFNSRSSDIKEIVIDQDIQTVLPFDREKHDSMYVVLRWMRETGSRKFDGMPEDVIEKKNRINKRYRKIILDATDVDAVKFLLDNELVVL